MHRMPDPLDLLSHGVPLTLLVDLLDEHGPDSRRMYDEEQADTSWLAPHYPRSA